MTVPRPASEHARELSRKAHKITKGRYGPVPTLGDFDTLLSALAVVEQERDELREALRSEIRKRHWAIDGGPLSDEWLEAKIAQTYPALAASSVPAEEQG